MLLIMNQHPKLNVVWSNMRCWQETKDGWEDTGKLVWKNNLEDLKVFHQYSVQQLHQTFHSNGAMLVRSKNVEKYKIPSSANFDIMEALRERCYDYPIGFVNKELANFSLTLITARKNNKFTWNANQVLLAGSFLSHIKWNKKAAKAFWSIERKLPTCHHYLFACIFYPKLIKLMFFIPLKHLPFAIGYHIKNMYSSYKAFRYIFSNRDLRIFIDKITSDRNISFRVEN
jgi:hypothetical protein